MEELVRGKSVELELEPHALINQLTEKSTINNSCISDMRVTQLRFEFMGSVLSVI